MSIAYQRAADSLTSKTSEDSTIAALPGIKATLGARLCQGNKRVIIVINDAVKAS